MQSDLKQNKHVLSGRKYILSAFRLHRYFYISAFSISFGT